MKFRDLTPQWFETHSPYRDPPEPPEFWTETVRSIVTDDGTAMVLVRNQDGEEYLIDPDDQTQTGEP